MMLKSSIQHAVRLASMTFPCFVACIGAEQEPTAPAATNRLGKMAPDACELSRPTAQASADVVQIDDLSSCWPKQAPFSQEEVASWLPTDEKPAVWLGPGDAAVDPLIEQMDAPQGYGGPHRVPPQERYFLKPIPRTIHLLGAGDVEQTDLAANADWYAWERYCRRFNYACLRWGHDAPTMLAGRVSDDFIEQLVDAQQSNDPEEVIALMRIGVLAAEGGIAVSAGATPPTWQGELIDLDRIMPMRNLVMITADRCRFVGRVSTTFDLRLVLASPQQRFIAHLAKQVVINRKAWKQHQAPICAYTAGTLFVSRSFSGATSIMPADYARQMGILMTPL